jgi:hypothetical protein
VSVTDDLEAAAAAGGRHAAPGERVAAVMVAEPGLDERVYLVAFERNDELGYLALDERLEPLDDRRLVRDAVVMIGLAERAEEASSATQADELKDMFSEAATELERAGLEQAAAARAVVEGLDGLSAASQGPRVATAAYLDAIGAASGRLAVALVGLSDVLELLPASPAVEAAAAAAWRALAAAAAAGDPSQFSHAMTATTGAVEALADDVLERLRVV